MVRKIQFFRVLHIGQNLKICFIISLKYSTPFNLQNKGRIFQTIVFLYFGFIWFFIFKALKDFAVFSEKIMRNWVMQILIGECISSIIIISLGPSSLKNLRMYLAENITSLT